MWIKFDGVKDFVVIKRPRILNKALSYLEIANIYQYECWFFQPWYKKIILFPKHLYLYCKFYSLVR